MTIDTAALRGLLEESRGDFEALHRYLDAVAIVLPELLDRMEALEKAATEARYYLLHGGSLADLEMALRDAGYGGGGDE